MMNVVLIQGAISSGSGSDFYIQNSGATFTAVNEVRCVASGDVAIYAATVVGDRGRIVIVKGAYDSANNRIIVETINSTKDSREIGSAMETAMPGSTGEFS
jgi:hypothetical protein